MNLEEHHHDHAGNGPSDKTVDVVGDESLPYLPSDRHEVFDRADDEEAIDETTGADHSPAEIITGGEKVRCRAIISSVFLIRFH